MLSHWSLKLAVTDQACIYSVCLFLCSIYVPTIVKAVVETCLGVMVLVLCFAFSVCLAVMLSVCLPAQLSASWVRCHCGRESKG